MTGQIKHSQGEWSRRCDCEARIAEHKRGFLISYTQTKQWSPHLPNNGFVSSLCCHVRGNWATESAHGVHVCNSTALLTSSVFCHVGQTRQRITCREIRRCCAGPYMNIVRDRPACTTCRHASGPSDHVWTNAAAAMCNKCTTTSANKYADLACVQCVLNDILECDRFVALEI